MRIIGAKSATTAMRVSSVFQATHPDFYAAVMDFRPGGTYLIDTGDEIGEAKALDLQLLDGDLAFRIIWADDSVQSLPVVDIDGLTAEAPKLPTCTGFKGQGARCSSCRIRKPLHA